MSGGIPKKVWQGKMRTKTNQTGMKMVGNPSMIGRKTLNTRYINRRVNPKIVLCGWRCRYGVNGNNAGSAARAAYCKNVVPGQPGGYGVLCRKPQPLTANLAGGVGNVPAPRNGGMQSTCAQGGVLQRCSTCSRTSTGHQIVEKLIQDDSDDPQPGGIFWAVDNWIDNPGQFQSGGIYEKYGTIDNWDTSQINNMDQLFAEYATFDDDISGWNTSQVTNMYGMFLNALAFNQDIGGWGLSLTLWQALASLGLSPAGSKKKGMPGDYARDPNPMDQRPHMYGEGGFSSTRTADIRSGEMANAASSSHAWRAQA